MLVEWQVRFCSLQNISGALQKILKKCDFSKQQKQVEKIAPYSLFGIIQNSRGPEITNWFD